MDDSPRALLEPSGAVLARALAQVGGTGDRGLVAARLRLFGQWPQLVGPRIARRTRPAALSDDVLWVEVDSATWQNEITFLQQSLVRSINSRLGLPVLRQLRVRSARPLAPEAAPPPPLGPVEPDDVAWAQAFSTPITDPDVRAAFEGMVAHHARRRRRDAGNRGET